MTNCWASRSHFCGNRLFLLFFLLVLVLVLVIGLNRLSEREKDRERGRRRRRGRREVQSGRARFLRPQGLLITLQRLPETFHPVKQAAFVKVSDGERAVCGDGQIVA